MYNSDLYNKRVNALHTVVVRKALSYTKGTNCLYYGSINSTTIDIFMFNSSLLFI